MDNQIVVEPKLRFKKMAILTIISFPKKMSLEESFKIT